MLLKELEDGIRILRLDSDEEIAQWRAGFCGAYQTIFAEEPYQEAFSVEEADGVYRKLTSTQENISLLAVRGDLEVVGFGIAIPLRYKTDVSQQLAGLISVNHNFYLAELGILSQYRRRGLGRILVRMRLDNIDAHKYRGVLMRTTASRNTTYAFYRSMGFEDMGVYMEVPSRRTDGRVTTDRRLFLHCMLSQVDDPQP